MRTKFPDAIDKSKQRRQRNVAHSWQDKRINRFFRKSGNFSKIEIKNLRNVYLALTEIDSDFGGSKEIRGFTKTVASYSCLHYDLIHKYLRAFKVLGLIDYNQIMDKNGHFGVTQLTMYKWVVPSVDKLSKVRYILSKELNSPSTGNTGHGETGVYKNKLKSLSEGDKFPTPPDPEDPPVVGKKDTRTQKINSLEWGIFLQLLPSSYLDNIEFRHSLKDFIAMRRKMKNGKGRLTELACKRMARYWLRHPILNVIAALNKTIEGNWVGVFPESITKRDLEHYLENYQDNSGKASQSQSQVSANDPCAIISTHFPTSPGKISADDWPKLLQSSLNLFNGIDPNEKAKIALGICSMADWLTSNQKRPIFDEVPDFHQTGRDVYSKWRAIPWPFKIIQKYVDWISDQQWISNLTSSVFDPGSKIFLNYMNEAQKDIGFDFLTGRDLQS